MKHLLILLLTSLLVGCNSYTNTTYSVATQYQQPSSMTAISFNTIKKHHYTVPRVAQAEYNRCVDFALRSMQVGEQCKWEVPGQAVGIVKLVKIDAPGCHYMFNTMMYKGKQKNFQKTACYNNATKHWQIK